MLHVQVRAVFDRFFAVRGTHLAAMVAFFALASFVPILFLLLSILGLFREADESSALVSYLRDVFPAQSVNSIVSVVNAVQRNAGTLTIVGVVGLAWSALSLVSALESAFNIVYDLPNRAFLRGKRLAVAFTVALILALFISLIAGTFGHDLLGRYAPSIVGSAVVALLLTLLASALGAFVFLAFAYRQLTNTPLEWRAVLPGAVIGSVVLAGTLQALPLFVYLASGIVALQALGTTFLLLVWLYLMANVIVFGAVLNHEVSASNGRHTGPAPAND